MLPFLQPMVITDMGLMSNTLTASSRSHNRCMPFMVMCPNEVGGCHRILFYMVFQTSAVSQLGLVPCLFSTLPFVQYFKKLLALCLLVGFAQKHSQIGLDCGTRSESGTRVRLGHLFLQGLQQVACISFLKDTIPIKSSSIPETTHF